MAKAEVARILVEKRRQDSVAEEVAAEVVCIVGAVARGVACEALAVAGVLVFSLTDASVDAGQHELVGVKRTLEEEMELLARAERRGFAVVNGVEVRESRRPCAGALRALSSAAARALRCSGVSCCGGVVVC